MDREHAFECRIRFGNDWFKLESSLPMVRAGRPAKDNRNFFEAVHFRFRTGIPWRDLAPTFGPSKTIYIRFNDWSKDGYMTMIFETTKTMTGDIIVMIDSTSERVYQHAAGARREKGHQRLGRSAGGLTSKLRLSFSRMMDQEVLLFLAAMSMTSCMLAHFAKTFLAARCCWLTRVTIAMIFV